jgi:hypothetical protein
MSDKVKLTLVQRIVSFLKQDDKGKVQSFFDAETKNCKVQIKKLDANLKRQELNDEIELDELERKIEDAEQAVDDAYLNVDITRIQTNQDKADFSKYYWDGVISAERKLSRLKETQVEKLKWIKSFKEDNTTQKEAYSNRIARLNS